MGFTLSFQCDLCPPGSEPLWSIDVSEAIPRRYGSPVVPKFFARFARQLYSRLLQEGQEVYDLDIPSGVEIEGSAVTVQGKEDSEPRRYAHCCRACQKKRDDASQKAEAQVISRGG